MTPQARTQLTASPRSAHAAREFVREVLEMWDCDDPEEVAVLLTSEVVSNAVLHAATALALEVELSDDGILRIAVSDGHSALPALRAPGPEATGGRGLLLVETLAERWGADLGEHGGKVVWFELPTPRSDSEAGAAS